MNFFFCFLVENMYSFSYIIIFLLNSISSFIISEISSPSLLISKKSPIICFYRVNLLFQDFEFFGLVLLSYRYILY